MQSVPSGCIALPRWLRKSLLLADDLISHRVTVTFIPVRELPVAVQVNLRCVAKNPPSLPDFQASTSSTLSLSCPDVILVNQLRFREFKSLTVGMRFDISYCSTNDGGCWEFEIYGIKARHNCFLDVPGNSEMLLSEGSCGCVFSNCENTGNHSAEYVVHSDVSSSPLAPRFQSDKMEDTPFDFQQHSPTLVFTPAAARVSPVQQLAQEFLSLFGRQPDSVAFAPGRLEFLGNHLDYNGGPVHAVAIDKGVTVCAALQQHNLLPPQITLRTSQIAYPVGDDASPPPEVSVLFEDLQKQACPGSRAIPAWALYAVSLCYVLGVNCLHGSQFRHFFIDNGQVGVLHVMRSAGMKTPCGCMLYISSTLDMGAGLRHVL
jgi:hypothetical protein